MDHHHPLAQLLDVGHIVAREQDRDPEPAVIVAQEGAHGPLGDDVEPDGRFVEEQHFRRVEQGGDQFHLHALAEAQLAHHHVELGPHPEQIRELVEGLLVLGRRDAIDVPEEQERLHGGEIPPKLILLPEHEGKDPAVGVLPLGGIETRDPGRATRRIDQAREHFERGCLAGAVGAEKPDELALGDAERKCRAAARVSANSRLKRPRTPPQKPGSFL